MRLWAIGSRVWWLIQEARSVADICDAITVLQRGEILAEGPYAEVAANPAVREAYMGAEDE